MSSAVLYNLLTYVTASIGLREKSMNLPAALIICCPSMYIPVQSGLYWLPGPEQHTKHSMEQTTCKM